MHIYTSGIRACDRILNMFLDCDHVSGIRSYFWNTNIMRITQASSGEATPRIVKDAPFLHICILNMHSQEAYAATGAEWGFYTLASQKQVENWHFVGQHQRSTKIYNFKAGQTLGISFMAR